MCLLIQNHARSVEFSVRFEDEDFYADVVWKIQHYRVLFNDFNAIVGDLVRSVAVTSLNYAGCFSTFGYGNRNRMSSSKHFHPGRPALMENSTLAVLITFQEPTLVLTINY